MDKIQVKEIVITTGNYKTKLVRYQNGKEKIFLMNNTISDRDKLNQKYFELKSYKATTHISRSERTETKESIIKNYKSIKDNLVRCSAYSDDWSAYTTENQEIENIDKIIKLIKEL